MRALVIGGTGFLGGAITNATLNKGFDVDVLTRTTLESEHPQLTYLRGDRYENFPELQKKYDFVFDTCAFEPEAIKSVINNLDVESLKRYIFISSASVYEEYLLPGLSEDIELKGASQSDFDLVNSLPSTKKTSAFSYGDSYGPLKRECELLLERGLGEKAIMLRSGLLVGAGDYTDRLTWWVRRIDLAGVVACPMPKDRNVQLIDVRDAAEFAVKSAVDGKSGVFNLTGHQVTFEKLLDTIQSESGRGASFKWFNLSSFTNQNLEPWTDIPLALPEVESLKYFFDIDTKRALEAGLVLRKLEDTILNVLEWDRENRERPLKCGYGNETEQAVALDQGELG